MALSRVGDPRFIKVLVMDTGEQGRYEGKTGVFTVNIVYPEILAEARRLLRESLASQTSPASSESITCMRCDPPQRQNDPQPMVNSSETTPAQAANDTCDPSNAPHDDDVDADAVDANIERNLLAPLRSSGIHMCQTACSHNRRRGHSHIMRPESPPRKKTSCSTHGIITNFTDR